MDWLALNCRASDVLERPSRRRLLSLALLTAGCIGATSSAFAAGGRAASFEAIDRDRNGTINLDEAKRAAAILFDQLDRHRTGKLSRTQLGRGRMTLAEFSWADRDHDGTLTKDEYLALVERQFRVADLDHDGTVSGAEFRARSGLPLRRLLY
jgi:Ca2+-binding EF-hand superfamily protein